eukprot:COSAG01_NODE_11646_length_1888_cov_19.550028_1_plen_24_part_10
MFMWGEPHICTTAGGFAYSITLAS